MGGGGNAAKKKNKQNVSFISQIASWRDGWALQIRGKEQEQRHRNRQEFPEIEQEQ